MRPGMLEHPVIEDEPLNTEAPVMALPSIRKVAADAVSAAHNEANTAEGMPLLGRYRCEDAQPIEEPDPRGHHALATGLVPGKAGPVQKDHVMARFGQQPCRRGPGY